MSEGNPPTGGGFRVVDTTTLCDAGFLRVSRRRIVGPDGEEHDRHVVHHPGAVVVVPVEGDDALLVRQFRAATGGVILEVPAGKRDVPGEAPEVTASRELGEEIGRRADRLELLCEFFNTPGFCDEYTYLYLATELTEVPRHAVSAEEAHLELVRVPLIAIDDLIARREIVDAKTIIGLLLARDRLAARTAEG